MIGQTLAHYRVTAALGAGTLVTATGSLSVGDARKLFDLRAGSGRSAIHAGYDVAPDGKRFLVQRLDPRAIPTQINVVLNCFEELKARVPAR